MVRYKQAIDPVPTLKEVMMEFKLIWAKFLATVRILLYIAVVGTILYLAILFR